MNLHTPASPVSSLEIYWDLRRRMVAADFEPGERLKPDVLRQSYDCSASTMREVLFRLSCDRLIDFQDQRGFRMPASTRAELEELTALRIMIEQEGARLSIEKGDLEWEANLTAAYHRLDHVEASIVSGERVEYDRVLAECEIGFHVALIAANGSTALSEMHRDIYDRQRLRLALATGGTLYRHGATDEHLAIQDAALARDAALCQRLLHDHMWRTFDINEMKFT